MMRRAAITILFIAIVSTKVQADFEARTWTSLSGATVDAVFVEFSAGFVVLEQIDGNRFQIHPSNLSEDDREYLSELAQGIDSDDVADVSPSGEPTVLPGTEGDADRHIFAEGVFAEPQVLAAADFTNFTPSDPAEARYLGVQYGPRAEDVVYMAVDYREAGELPPTIAVHNFGRAGVRGPSYTLSARRTSMRTSDGDRVRVARFELQPLRAEFGSIEIETSIEILAGFDDPFKIHLKAESSFRVGRENYSFEIGDEIAAKLSAGTGNINVLRLFAEPEIEVRGRWRRVDGMLKMGDWILVPGSGMDNSISIAILDDDDRSLETGRARLQSEKLLEGQVQGLFRLYEPRRFDRAGTYGIETSIDLGSVLGEVSTRARYEVR